MRLACLIAATAALSARAEQELPLYPGTVHTRVGDELIINGEQFRIAYFTTRDPLTRVAEYFFQEWKRRGLPTTVDGDFRTEMVVSAFYVRDGLQRSVVLRSHQGQTVGFSVLRDLWLSAASGPELAAPKETVFSQQLLLRDEVGQNRHLSALIELDLIAASMRVREELGTRGFALSREMELTASGDRGFLLEHVRDGARVQTVVTAIATGLTAMTQTWWPEQLPAAAASDIRIPGRKVENK
jgi:hypothetical protein